MRRIRSCEELVRAADGYLRPGVMANVMLTGEKFGPDIQAGRLFVEAGEHNLWIVVRREDHVRLYFYLNDPALPLGELFDLPVSAEMAFRGDGERLAPLEACLALCGLRPVFRRVRLTRPPEPRTAEGGAPVGRPSGAQAVFDFLRSNFSPVTGCLPAMDEVLSGMADQRFLSIEDETGIAGLIHMTREKNNVEIRHLAVREDRRGQGLAVRLAAACIGENPGKPCRVWVREDYDSARRVYAKAGFRPDGLRSLVFHNAKETDG